MPGLSGPAIQERLRELGATLPIIFLTGHPDIQAMVRAIKAGAEDFLTKPVSSEVLLEAVARAITQHELSRDLIGSCTRSAPIWLRQRPASDRFSNVSFAATPTSAPLSL